MNRCHIQHLATALLCILLCSSACADNYQFHGYVSQGMVISNDNPFYVKQTGTHFDYHEIGLNGSGQLNDDWRMAGQVLSRKAGELDDGNPKVDFLLLDYSLSVTEDLTSGIRVGRVKNPYGIYNTTRDVPHVRPGVFVPQSVYFETFRKAILSVDGANLYLSKRTSLGDLSLDLFGGQSHIDNEAVEVQIYQKDITGTYKEVDTLGFKFSLVPKNLSNLTVALTLMDISMELEDAPVFSPVEQFSAAMILASDPTAFSNYITSQNIDSFLTLVSLQYNWLDWVFTTEYLDVETKVSNFEVLHSPYQSYDATSNAYYLQAEWLASEKYSFYTRHEKLFYNMDDKYGVEFALTSGGNPVTQYTKANTLGARWYFTPDLALTGEYSRNQGTAFINGSANIDYSRLNKNWDLFILQLSYHF